MQSDLPTSERWDRLANLFNRAIRQDPESLSDFLDETCGTDFELRTELSSLLTHSRFSSDLLEEARPDSAPIRTGLVVDHYRVIRILGSGAMGQVYLAQDLRLQRQVALKVLPPAMTRDPEAFRRFEAEAQAVSALNHPNILTIYDFCSMGGLHFIVTEFVEGDTLRQILRNGPLEQETVVRIGIQAAGALAAAHSKGIIHRDIKPENIIVREDGLVKVVDFGIAKLIQPEEQAEESAREPRFATRPGLLVGTPEYMSPEQARGLSVDSRTDIFSLGAVFYEALTGRGPFDGPSLSDVIAEILKSEPVAITALAPQVSNDLEQVVGRCLEKDRTNRYGSAEELLSDLQKAEQGAKPVPITSRLPNAKRIVLISTALLVLIIAGYLAFTKLFSGHSSQQPRSMAVLPFRNIKQDAQVEFLSFSLADAVITKLGYVRAIAVRPSASIDKYRGQTADLKKIASDLGTDLLLTGSYIRDGNDLRVMTQLVSAKSNEILWRDTLDVNYDNLLAVQDRVAQRVVQGLELELSPAEKEHLRAETPINSLAYQYYLRGVDLYSIGEFSLAERMLEKSIALEPRYAPTWAYLGQAYTTDGSLQAGGRESYEKAQNAYEKAIALNPAYPEPRIYMANLLTDTGRVEESVPLLKEALASSPNNAEAHWELGYAYRYGGMLKQSVAECERARRLDPEVKINSSALNSYFYLGEYDKFLQSIPANDSDYLLFYRGLGEYYKGNWSAATTDFDRSFERSPSLLPARVGKALSDGIAHRNADGLTLLGETENRIDRRGVADAELLYKLAQGYAVLKDKPSALRLLQRTVDGGFFPYSYFASDPLLGNLRGDPKFEELLQQARIRHQQFAQRFCEHKAEGC